MYCTCNLNLPFHTGWSIVHVMSLSKEFMSSSGFILDGVYNFFDIILGVLIAVSLYNGYKKGFVYQAVSLLTIVISVYIAINFSDWTARFISQYIDFGGILSLISFLITFLVSLVVIHKFAQWIDRSLKFLLLGGINRILGMIFSFLKAIIIMSSILLFVDGLNKKLHWIEQKQMKESKLYEPIKNLIPNYFPFVKGWYFQYIQPKVEKAVKDEL